VPRQKEQQRRTVSGREEAVQDQASFLTKDHGQGLLSQLHPKENSKISLLSAIDDGQEERFCLWDLLTVQCSQFSFLAGHGGQSTGNEMAII
jgi:hypothetical protein